MCVPREGCIPTEADTDTQEADALNTASDMSREKSGTIKAGAPSPIPLFGHPIHPSPDPSHLPLPAVSLAPTLAPQASTSHNGNSTSNSLQGAQNTRVETLEVMHVAGNVDRHTSYTFYGPVFAIGTCLKES